MAKRPLHAGPHLLVVVRIREHPLRGALKHGEAVDVRSDRRGDLKSAGTRADHRDVLVAQVHRVVPLAGMERRPGEVLLPVDVRHVGPVELSDSADHRARREFRRLAVAVARANRPRRIGVVPRRLGHLGLPADVRRNVVFLHDALEIGVQLGLFGEEVRPVIGRLEAVAIEVISHVDPRTGVGVLVPRAADARVLLHDGERNAGLLEPDPGQQAGFTASDHDDSEVLAGGLRYRVRRPGVAAVEFHLLEHHRDVFGRHRFANQPLHHLVQQLGADGLGFRAPAISVVRDDLERDLADRGLVLFGHVALHFVEKQACRLQIAADQLGVAGHMHQRQHQGRDADVEQRFGYLVVRCRKWLSGMWVTHPRCYHAHSERPKRSQTCFSEMLRLLGLTYSRRVGIATKTNGTAPPDVPLSDIDLGDWKFWVLDDDMRDGAFTTLRREAPVSFHHAAADTRRRGRTRPLGGDPVRRRPLRQPPSPDLQLQPRHHHQRRQPRRVGVLRLDDRHGRPEAPAVAQHRQQGVHPARCRSHRNIGPGAGTPPRREDDRRASRRHG